MVIYKKVYAFVDTSVLDPMYNDYSKLEKVFQNLKKHISNNKLVLFTHEIAIREVMKHIQEQIPKQLDGYRKIQKCKELITKTRLFLDGLTGGDNSSSKRDELAKRFNLPDGMSSGALLEALNLITDLEGYKKALKSIGI